MDFEQKIDSVLFGNNITEAYDYGIPNPKPGKTLDDLKKVRKPIENGWTTEEVYSALKPTIISLANRYSTPTFSADEAASMAYDAISDAIKNDEGKSAFTSYVFNWLKTKMRREAARASNVSGVPYSAGGKEDIYAGSKASVSADVPVNDKGATLVSNIAASDEQESDSGKARNLLDVLLDLPSVGLNDVEKNLLRTLGGLGGDEAKTVGDISKEKGVSPARISQIRAKAFAKIQDYLQSKGYKDHILASRGLGLENKIRQAAEAWVSIITEMINAEIKMIEEGLTSAYYKTIISESIASTEKAIIENTYDDVYDGEDNSDLIRSKPKSGLVTQFSAPYSSVFPTEEAPQGANATLRVIFSLYGEGLEMMDIIRVDNLDTGATNIPLDQVNYDVLEDLVDDQYRLKNYHSTENDNSNDDKSIDIDPEKYDEIDDYIKALGNARGGLSADEYDEARERWTAYWL